MFVTISYVPHTSRNQLSFVRIFKFSKSDSNVFYDMLCSTYKRSTYVTLPRQALPVSAVNSADLCFLAMSVYTSARL